jgi:hypothetical protein
MFREISGFTADESPGDGVIGITLDGRYAAVLDPDQQAAAILCEPEAICFCCLSGTK